jgi:hypothetical protein
MGTEVAYDSITTGFLSYLIANTSTINSGITDTVTTFIETDPEEYDILATMYPALTVDLKSTNERDFMELGSYTHGRCNIEFSFNVGVHIRMMASSSAAIKSLRKLTSNVAKAIRTDVTLSNTVNSLLIDGVEFNSSIQGKQGVYQKNAIIKVTANKFI